MCRRADSAGASEDFSNVCVTAVRGIDTGRTQILAHHIVQSFAPDEVTPEQALQIGEELCDRFLQGNYQYVLAVHTDKSHTHCHIIFNNTNLYNGLSFTTEHNQGRKETELVKLITAECRSTGNIQKLLKRLFAGTVEQIFEAEMDEHLGYEKNSVLGNILPSVPNPPISSYINEFSLRCTPLKCDSTSAVVRFDKIRFCTNLLSALKQRGV